MNTHPEQWAANAAAPREQFGAPRGFGALLKGLTSVVVLKVERALDIHSPHLQSLPDLRLEPTTFGLQARLSTIWPRLAYPIKHKIGQANTTTVIICSKSIKGVIGCKIHFSSCLNINVCWKCVYTSIL